MASVSQTFNGAIGSSARISRTTNAYCDKTSTSSPGTISSGGTAPAACTTTALVQRPYLSQTLEEGWDIQTTPVDLPKVTTTNEFSDAMDPTLITVKTTGRAASVNQTFTKITTNTYLSNVTDCAEIQTCNWILGRLKTAKVDSTVPNSLGSIITASGVAASASGDDDASTQVLNPLLNIILLTFVVDD